MDHAALEAELKRIEARAKARRKRFAAAVSAMEQTQGSRWSLFWRANQVKVICTITALAAAVPVVRMLQLSSQRQAFAQERNGKAPYVSVPVVDVPPAPHAAGSAAGTREEPQPKAPPADPVRSLFERVQEREFTEPADVAVGPFLKEFATQIRQVDQVDLNKLRSRRRGVDWTVVLAPLKVEEAPWERPKPRGRLEVRCVKGKGDWKIEQMVTFVEAGS